jgi:hypothetical protein
MSSFKTILISLEESIEKLWSLIFTGLSVRSPSFERAAAGSVDTISITAQSFSKVISPYPYE